VSVVEVAEAALLWRVSRILESTCSVDDYYAEAAAVAVAVVAEEVVLLSVSHVSK
jgi:hypothetical protein